MINHNKIFRRIFIFLIFVFFTLTIFYQTIVNGYILLGNQDRMDQNVPAMYYYYRALHNGELPEWNPYILCGTTGMGNAYNSFFYPFLTPLFLFMKAESIPQLETFLVMIHYLFALFFGFIFFYSLFKNKTVSIISTIIYGFSGALLYNLSIGITNILCFTYFPLLMYLVWTYKQRSFLSNILFNTLVLALLFLAGNPQIILYILAIYFTFYLYLVSENYLHFKIKVEVYKRIISLIISLSLSLMLSSLRILPFYYWKKLDETSFSFNNFFEYTNHFRINIIELFRIFAPHFLGVFDEYQGINLDFYESFFAYSAILPVMLTIFSIFFIHNKKLIYWKILLFLLLFTVLGTPVTFIHHIFTRSNTIYFTRVYYFIPFVIAVLTGYSLLKIFSNKTYLKKFLFFLTILSSIISLFFYIYFSLKKNSLTENNLYLMKFSLVYFILISFISILFIFIKLKLNLKPAILFSSLTVFIFFDLYYTNYVRDVAKYLFTKGSLFVNDKDTSYSKKLFDQNNRFYRINDVARNSKEEEIGEDENNCNNMNIVFDYYVSYGYDNIIPKRLIKLYGFLKNPDTRKRKIWPRDSRINQLTSSAVDLLDKKVSQVELPLPRFKLFGSFEVIENDENLYNRITSKDFDYFNTVLLNQKPKLEIKKEISGKIFVKEKFNTIKIDVKTDGNAILLINDTYDDGWQALIDDKKTDIILANYAFKAIVVPEGEHKIKLYYRHKGVNQGIFLTSVASFIIVIIIFLLIKKKQN